MRYPYFLLVSLIAFLSAACTQKQDRLVGTWLDLEDGRSLMVVTPDKEIIYDQVVRKQYTFIKPTIIEVTATASKEQFEVDFAGDTLILTGIESRKKYLPPAYFEQPETLRRRVEQEAAAAMEKTVTSVQLTPKKFGDIMDEDITLNTLLLKDITPESELHIGDVYFTGGKKITVAARVMHDEKGIPSILWRETVESALQRSFESRLLVLPTTLQLQKQKRSFFTGLAIMPEGDSLAIELDLNKSWMPTASAAAMGVYTKYQLNTYMGQGVVKYVRLKTEDQFHYEGTAYISPSEQLRIKTDRLKGWSLSPDPETAKHYARYALQARLGGVLPSQITEVKRSGEHLFGMRVKVPTEERPFQIWLDTESRTWYPVDEIASLEVVTKLQLAATATGITPLEVRLTPKEKGIYEGTARYTKGIVKQLLVKHSGQGFTWEILQAPQSGEKSS
ncbi:MAG: hypothetical protein ACFCUI_03440 [Bernardetiaceae bacterium]